jgi:hypothetical protein
VEREGVCPWILDMEGEEPPILGLENGLLVELLCKDIGGREGARSSRVLSDALAEVVSLSRAVLITRSLHPYSTFETPPARGSLLKRADQ